MNKLFFVFILFFFVISISGCSKNEAYPSEEAINSGDVVVNPNGVKNLERFNQFLKNLSNNEEDTIRITSYTIEGDPIFRDLKFDGKVIRYRYDSSNDKFAGNNKGVETVTCTKINREELKKGEVSYFIKGCSKKVDGFLIRVNKDEY